MHKFPWVNISSGQLLTQTVIFIPFDVVIFFIGWDKGHFSTHELLKREKFEGHLLTHSKVAFIFIEYFPKGQLERHC